MTLHYQYARPGGNANWTEGQEEFQSVWDNAVDALRFSRGQGFRIVVDHDEGPARKLWESDDFLKARLGAEKVDTVVRLRAEKDGNAVLFRRHEVASPKNQQLIDAIARRVGTPYVYRGLDCSGLVMAAVEEVTGQLLPHNADAMRADSRFKTITREEATMGDFLFIDRDSKGVEHHIATLLSKSSDRYPGGLVVWDTEPSDTTSPGGWPNPFLGTGVRVRPAFLPWYCGRIASFARLGSING